MSSSLMPKASLHSWAALRLIRSGLVPESDRERFAADRSWSWMIVRRKAADVMVRHRRRRAADDPPILADHQQAGGSIAAFDELLDDVVRLAARSGVDGPDAAGTEGSAAGRRIAIAHQEDLIPAPAALERALTRPSIHPRQIRGQDPGLVQGIHGVDKYLHGVGEAEIVLDALKVNSSAKSTMVRLRRCPPKPFVAYGEGRVESNTRLPPINEFGVQIPVAIRIKSRQGESVNQMLRRFKKLCEKEGLTKDVKEAVLREALGASSSCHAEAVPERPDSTVRLPLSPRDGAVEAVAVVARTGAVPLADRES